MSRLLLTALTFVVVFFSVLFGVLGVASLAVGRAAVTLGLLAAAAATAWLAFHLPRSRGRR